MPSIRGQEGVADERGAELTPMLVTDLERRHIEAIRRVPYGKMEVHIYKAQPSKARTVVTEEDYTKPPFQQPVTFPESSPSG